MRLLQAMSDKDNKSVPFWRKVQKGEDHECWEWKGEIDILSGFGISRKLVAGNDINRKAHRIAYILTYGAVPAGHVIRHTCRNQLCCNPSHLIPMRKHPEEEDEVVVAAMYYQSRRASRLSDFEKRRIVQLRNDGVKVKDLSERFRVSRSSISRAIRGKR
tara:strand:- start:884 stop:1363 length:480 start_codon:yes stop_codon:yes gene_type:complete